MTSSTPFGFQEVFSKSTKASNLLFLNSSTSKFWRSLNFWASWSDIWFSSAIHKLHVYNHKRDLLLHTERGNVIFKLRVRELVNSLVYCRMTGLVWLDKNGCAPSRSCHRRHGRAVHARKLACNVSAPPTKGLAVHGQYNPCFGATLAQWHLVIAWLFYWYATLQLLTTLCLPITAPSFSRCIECLIFAFQW